MLGILTLHEICEFLQIHQARLRFDRHIPSMSDLASQAGVSRQTLYAVMKGERSEFGQVAQIRLSRVISQISSKPSYQHSKMARIDLTGAMPRIRFRV